MRPPLSRLGALALALCAPPANAVVSRPASLIPALSLAQSVPAFRESMLTQIRLVSTLSSQSKPSLSPLAASLPTATDPWRAESARIVGALVAQPAAVSAHQSELRAVLGDTSVDELIKAAARIQVAAASGGALAEELDVLRRGLDLGDASAVEALANRLNALFEASKTPLESAVFVTAAGQGGSKKPLVSLSRAGEKPAMSAAELEAYVVKNSVVSPRGLKRVNFASGDYRPEYDAVLRKLGVDATVIKAPSRAELGRFKEEDGYHLKSEYVRWVMPAHSLEEHERALGKNRGQFLKQLKASEGFKFGPPEPLTAEKYASWYPLYQEEIVLNKPGGKSNVGPNFVQERIEKGDIAAWHGLFYYDPADPAVMVGGVIMKAWSERGMFVMGYAAYRPDFRKANPNVRNLAEILPLARKLGFKVVSFGQDTNFFGYDYTLGLMSNKAGHLLTPYPEDEIVLLKVLDTRKILSVQDKQGKNGGYFFFGIKRDSPLVERYLASKEAGEPKEAQELLGGGYFTPEILPAARTTVARRFKGNDPNPLRVPSGVEVVELPMTPPSSGD